MHNPHNIFYEVDKNGTSINIKGKSLFNYFSLNELGTKLIADSNYTSLNETCINHPDTIYYC